MDWYYAVEGRQVGPIPEAEFSRLVAGGMITPDTLVWRQGMAQWQTYGTLGVAAAVVTPGAGVAPPSVVRYGGFWIRFLARILDGIILWIVNKVVTLPLGIGALVIHFDDPENWVPFLGAIATIVLIQITISATYETVFIGHFGATPGKMALKLRVVRPDGSRLSYVRAFCRWLSTLLSSFILFIGYIIAAFDDQKRSLHDRICDTRVVSG